MRKQQERARLTRAKAIRAKCLDCCCGQPSEVRLCPATDCFLWSYRFGTGYEDQPENPRDPDRDLNSETKSG